jgi:hypothetical protein
MKLRWYQQRRRGPTAADVCAYAEKYELSILDAKRKLTPTCVPPVLQQWDEAHNGWIDVPDVVEIIE